jgi:hypothetical protein
VGTLKGCKDCPDREVGCHSKCKRYKDFKKECEKRSEARRKDQQGWSDWIGVRKSNPCRKNVIKHGTTKGRKARKKI